MKKLIFLAVIAIIAIAFTACNENPAPLTANDVRKIVQEEQKKIKDDAPVLAEKLKVSPPPLIERVCSSPDCSQKMSFFVCGDLVVGGTSSDGETSFYHIQYAPQEWKDKFSEKVIPANTVICKYDDPKKKGQKNYFVIAGDFNPTFATNGTNGLGGQFKLVKALFSKKNMERWNKSTQDPLHVRNEKKTRILDFSLMGS